MGGNLSKQGVASALGWPRENVRDEILAGDPGAWYADASPSCASSFANTLPRVGAGRGDDTMRLKKQAPQPP